jgi:hypothetical protein
MSHQGQEEMPMDQNQMANEIPMDQEEEDIDLDEEQILKLAEELKRYWVTDFERITKGRGI